MVLASKGSQGRVGIEASPDVHVVREELLFTDDLVYLLSFFKDDFQAS